MLATAAQPRTTEVLTQTAVSGHDAVYSPSKHVVEQFGFTIGDDGDNTAAADSIWTCTVLTMYKLHLIQPALGMYIFMRYSFSTGASTILQEAIGAEPSSQARARHIITC